VPSQLIQSELRVYEDFFHLRGSPFSMTPDPDYLFMTDCHREALSGLQLAVLKRAGFVVLTGGPGIGKTTLLACLVRSINSAHFAVVLNPTLDTDEFLEFVLIDFGIYECAFEQSSEDRETAGVLTRSSCARQDASADRR
jgi:type II secretory pathway predicted ATPase ExeA